MRSSFAPLALAVLTLATAHPATAAPVPDFRALYRSVDGTSASTDVSSTYDSGEGTHTLIARRVTQENREYVRTLRFKLDDERVRPLSYREEDRRCASCTVTVTFDWDRRFLQYDTRGEQRFASTAERDGTPSQLARDVAMLVSLLPGRRDVAGFDDALTGKSLGTVEFETPLGRVTADGRAQKGSWRQSVWLAREIDDLPVRIHAFSETVALTELTGIERSAAARPPAVADRATATVTTALTLPEYRAVYRVDRGKRAGVARFEVELDRDRAADRYQLVATAIETRRREDAAIERILFRVVGDSAYPLSLRIERPGAPLLVDATFDWALLEVLVRRDGGQQRYLLVDFDDPTERDDRSVRVALLQPLAASLALLPGDLSIAGFPDVLTAEPKGVSEIELPLGRFAVEGTVLLGEGTDASVEIWRAAALANLPVRLSGPLLLRDGATMELTELSGIERAGID